MSFEVLMIFIPASFALNLSPGPNNILAMNNGVRYGFWQKFTVAIGNPKAILILTAFFPQFMTPEFPSFLQFIIMGAAFLMLETIAIYIYAISGRQLGSFIQSIPGRRLFNRISGGILVGAGTLLAMTKRTA